MSEVERVVCDLQAQLPLRTAHGPDSDRSFLTQLAARVCEILSPYPQAYRAEIAVSVCLSVVAQLVDLDPTLSFVQTTTLCSVAQLLALKASRKHALKGGRAQGKENGVWVCLVQLTVSPQRVAEEQPVGSLFVEDDTGTVFAELADMQRDAVGSLVLLHSFTSIHTSTFPLSLLRVNQIDRSQTSQSKQPFTYLEVSGWSVIMPARQWSNVIGHLIPPAPDTATVSLSDRRAQKDMLQKHGVTHIHGHITALSPVMVIKSTPFFMVELSALVTPNTEEVDHENSQGGSEIVSTVVVFIGVEVVKWRQGLRIGGSYGIFNLKNKLYGQRKVLSASDSGPTVHVVAFETTSTLTSRHGGTITYSGAITSACPTLGLFVLDGKISLFCTHQEMTSYGRGLRVGASLTIDNAHPLFFRAGSTRELVGFVLCTLSTLQITEFSPDPSTPYTPLHPALPSSLFAPCQEVMNGPDYVWYLLTSALLAIKFRKLFMGSEKADVPASTTTRDLIGWLSCLDAPCQRRALRCARRLSDLIGCLAPYTRDVYEEFWSHDDVCSVSTTRTPTYPNPMPISELLALQPIKSFADTLRSSTSSDAAYREIPHSDLTVGLHLVAVLKVSSSTGHPMLADSTGQVRVSAPDLQLWQLNHVWHIPTFRILVESAGQLNDGNGSNVVISVAFDWADAQDLVNMHRGASTTRPTSTQSRTSLCVLVTHKHRSSPPNQSPPTFVFEGIVAPSLNKISQEHLAQGRAVRILLADKASTLYPAIHIGHCYVLTNLVVDSSNREIHTATNEATAQQLIGRSKGLSEEGKMETQEDKARAAGTIEVTDAEILTQYEAFLLDSRNMPCLKMESVGELLLGYDGRSAGDKRLVSFYGLVERRQTREGQAGTHNVLCLHIRDATGPHSLALYIDLQSYIYPLGLLPGVPVAVYRVAPRLSRHQTLYCSFTAVSFITPIPAGGTGGTDDRALRISEPWRLQLSQCAPPSSTLHLVATQPLISFYGRRARTLWRTVCRVVSVQGVACAWRCAACSCLAVGGMCRNKCSTSDQHLDVSARILVEDGSAQAHVTLQGRSLVLESLLQLTAHQISALEASVRQTGTVDYHRQTFAHRPAPIGPGPLPSDPTGLLGGFVGNPEIYRPMALYARQYFGGANLEGGSYEQITVRIAGTPTQTASRGRLMLHAVAMERVNSVNEARRMLGVMRTVLSMAA